MKMSVNRRARSAFGSHGPNFWFRRIPRNCTATCTARSSKIRSSLTRNAVTFGLISRSQISSQLSVELYLRIHSKHHSEKSKRKLILQLPAIITWDLAVAQRWLENMEISKTRISNTQSTFSFDLRSKSRQIEALRKFAATLKWPNMDEVEYVLDEQDLDERALPYAPSVRLSVSSKYVLVIAIYRWQGTRRRTRGQTDCRLDWTMHIHPRSQTH